jgi:hypothetical protein
MEDLAALSLALLSASSTSDVAAAVASRAAESVCGGPVQLLWVRTRSLGPFRRHL